MEKIVSPYNATPIESETVKMNTLYYLVYAEFLWELCAMKAS